MPRATSRPRRPASATPADRIESHAGKIFSSVYALFSGLLFVGAASLVLAPFVHRIMHRMHLDGERGHPLSLDAG